MKLYERGIEIGIGYNLFFILHFQIPILISTHINTTSSLQYEISMKSAWNQ